MVQMYKVDVQQSVASHSKTLSFSFPTLCPHDPSISPKGPPPPQCLLVLCFVSAKYKVNIKTTLVPEIVETQRRSEKQMASKKAFCDFGPTLGPLVAPLRLGGGLAEKRYSYI